VFCRHLCSGVSAGQPATPGVLPTLETFTPLTSCVRSTDDKIGDLIHHRIANSDTAPVALTANKALQEARGIFRRAETIAATNLQRVRARSYTRLDNKQDEQPYHGMRMNASSTLE
jgi:hypothetical protein